MWCAKFSKNKWCTCDKFAFVHVILNECVVFLSVFRCRSIFSTFPWKLVGQAETCWFCKLVVFQEICSQYWWIGLTFTLLAPKALPYLPSNLREEYFANTHSHSANVKYFPSKYYTSKISVQFWEESILQTTSNIFSANEWKWMTLVEMDKNGCENLRARVIIWQSIHISHNPRHSSYITNYLVLYLPPQSPFTPGRSPPNIQSLEALPTDTSHTSLPLLSLPLLLFSTSKYFWPKSVLISAKLIMIMIMIKLLTPTSSIHSYI